MVFDITKLNYICNKEHVISNFETNKIKVSRPELVLQSYQAAYHDDNFARQLFIQIFFCSFCETCNNILSLEKCM